jgi:peptide deformylase
MKDPIVQAGSLVLRQTAKPVGKKEFGSAKLTTLIRKMKAALTKEAYGVAIAAPQLGASVRVFVVSGRAFISQGEGSDDTAKNIPPDMVFINPELLRTSRKMREMSEGCLSVRGKYGTVLRHEKASVKACNEKGESFIYHGSGLLAHIFQHECDHLDGILYIDKAVKLTNDDERETLRANHPA